MFQNLNDQINNEFYNSLVYLTISNFYAQQKFNGLAALFKKQSEEEKGHAQKFIDYLLKFESGQEIKIDVKPPAQEWKNLYLPFEAALALEKTTTKEIIELMKLAIKYEDFAAQDLLQWYVTEQVQEEYQFNDLIAQLKLSGSYNDLALRLLNDRLLA